MSERTGTRLRDWSKRKLEARAAEDLARAEREATAEVPVAAETSEDAVAELHLPDIETLDKDSDFTPFLDARVPEELQRQALRKLWTSDPTFSELDGLNDYDPGYMDYLKQISVSAQAVLTKAIKEEEARLRAAVLEDTPDAPEAAAVPVEDPSPADAVPDTDKA